MNETAMIRTVVLAGPCLFGAICALRLHRRIAYLMAGLVPWCVFLAFNLYAEFYGLEQELLKGTWWLFQLTIGTLVAMIGLFSCWLVNKATK